MPIPGERFNVTLTLTCVRMSDNVKTLENELLQGDMSEKSMFEVESALHKLAGDLLKKQQDKK